MAWSHHLSERAGREAADLENAFQSAVSSFEGSVAIGGVSLLDPDRLFLALRGSGQALYVGLADNTFVVASEPYGVVELTDTYLRLDGETPGNPDSPDASRGQIVVLERAGAGELAGIRRLAYDGTELPVTAEDLGRLEITTRDIVRGDHPHYLVKEINEAPSSFQKTLRGRIRHAADSVQVDLPEASLPTEVVERLKRGEIERVVVIGQGTAAVAGSGVAAAIRDLLPDARSRWLRCPLRSSLASRFAKTCRTPFWWRSASRGRPRTPIAQWIWFAGAAPRSSPSSTVATAI